MSDLVPIPGLTLMVWNADIVFGFEEQLMHAAVMSSWSLVTGVASKR